MFHGIKRKKHFIGVGSLGGVLQGKFPLLLVPLVSDLLLVPLVSDLLLVPLVSDLLLVPLVSDLFLVPFDCDNPALLWQQHQ